MNNWQCMIKGFSERRQNKIKQLNTINSLKISEKVLLNEMISDLRHFRPAFWNRIRARFFGENLCLCLIHFPQNIDIIRYFPMPKPFVLNINNKLYLFTPKDFRFLNSMPKLEFYANIPFAILHNVTTKYTPPSLDADAFSSVQRSKFIQDAATVSDEKDINMWLLMAIIAAGLGFVMGIINLTYVLQILKHFPK